MKSFSIFNSLEKPFPATSVWASKITGSVSGSELKGIIIFEALSFLKKIPFSPKKDSRIFSLGVSSRLGPFQGQAFQEAQEIIPL